MFASARVGSISPTDAPKPHPNETSDTVMNTRLEQVPYGIPEVQCWACGYVVTLISNQRTFYVEAYVPVGDTAGWTGEQIVQAGWLDYGAKDQAATIKATEDTKPPVPEAVPVPIDWLYTGDAGEGQPGRTTP